ncbi:glycosyltransferase family 2 protein [Sphingomonas agri]|uniref:glycosyltransferase family 2 protein n=1 Tax=Sphingomonas agri TaxID=1813878 RepID=UPI00311DF9E5
MVGKRPAAGQGRKSRSGVIDEAVAVVVVNYRTPKLTAKCLAALKDERSSFRELKVMVVDGGSEDESAEVLSALIKKPQFAGWVTLLPLPLNGGFGFANNQAIQRLMQADQQLRYIHVLNPDAEIEIGAIRALAVYLNNHPHAGAVGSQLLEADGTSADSAFTFPSLRGEFSRGARTAALDRLFRVPPIVIDAKEASEVDWTTGASVMFRVEALREVGLFDEGFFLYHEEVELMWRLRQAGWQIALEAESRVRHVGGAATGMHDRDATPSMLPRRPRYWFRSRTRFLTLSRGAGFAAMAYFAWLLGYFVWFLRRHLGLAPEGAPIDHALRDHLANSFPKRGDAIPAVRKWNDPVSDAPAWMERGSW